MANQIYHLAEDYISGHAASYDGLPEEKASKALALACGQHLEGEGWNAADYGVDLNQIALEGLRRHRNA